MTKVEEIVVANLENAKANGAWELGGSLEGVSAEGIADDMTMYAADCEDLDPQDIVGYIRAWMEKEGLG